MSILIPPDSTEFKDDSNLVQPETETIKFPKVDVDFTVGDIVHCVGGADVCFPMMVSGIPDSYDKNGGIIVHLFLPAPRMVVVCPDGLVVYCKIGDKKTVDTWHTKAECTGCGRIKITSLSQTAPKLRGLR